MATYRKKLEVVHVMQWNGDHFALSIFFPDSKYDAGDLLTTSKGLAVHTDEGIVSPSIGDYLIKNEQDGFPAIKVMTKEEFESNFEEHKVVIPEEIAEWLEAAKEEAINYEYNLAVSVGCEDENILNQLKKAANEIGIDNTFIFSCLSKNTDCGINYWMNTVGNGFEIICNALIYGYEVENNS